MSPHVGATLVVARTTAKGNFLLAGDHEAPLHPHEPSGVFQPRMTRIYTDVTFGDGLRRCSLSAFADNRR